MIECDVMPWHSVSHDYAGLRAHSGCTTADNRQIQLKTKKMRIARNAV